MRPLTMVTGIVLGSSLSIAVSLAAVLLIFVVLGEEHPRVQAEFRPLAHSVMVFLAMTAISALSFYTLLTNHRGRICAQVLLWVGLLATGWYYWP